MKFILVSAFLCASPVLSAAPPTDADAKAELLVASVPRVDELIARLKAEASSIHDAQRRAEVLQFLDRPVFQVIVDRKKLEAEIVAKLQAEGLLPPEAKRIFSDEPPMRFAAAPGSVWLGHHSYPGGLVYHTLTNLRIGLGIAAVYKDVYGISLDEDLIRLAALMHDAAKTVTMHWNPDGSANGELMIAGTGAHHITMISEALYRGWPAQTVVILASAHSPPHPGDDLEKLLKFLRAGAIISGKPYEAAGLTSDGKALARPAPIEAFINHLDDHDYVFTETSLKAVAKDMDHNRKESDDYWTRDKTLSGQGDIPFYSRLLEKYGRPEQSH
ncbi:MAG: HD domain-containing protein [Elusimicrobiota bacterium]